MEMHAVIDDANLSSSSTFFDPVIAMAKPWICVAV